ncbi:MAG: AAA family ATPase [Acidobacteriaceae bacterium]
MKQFASFRLDIVNECLWRGDTSIALPPKPFAVLRYLVENPGRLITHDELLDALWPNTFVQPQILRTYILDLRKVLGDDSTQPRFIQTLPKRGYCFIAPVADALPSTRPPTPAPAPPPTLLIGRDEELHHLRTELQSLAAGNRRVLLITGEAGIGKTALVDEFCRNLVSHETFIVARGQCVEGFAAKEEYYPVTEALSQLCASSDGELACRILARRAPAWLASLGRDGDPSSDLVPTPDLVPAPQRMPGDLCAALEELAQAKPLIFILEDLHWADQSTLDLISALGRRRAAAPLLLLFTCGSLEGMAEPPLKGLCQDLLMRRLCTEMPLPLLNKAAVKELLSRKLQQSDLPSGLAAFVHQHSEGNPLFAIATLEHLIAQRFLVRENATAWRAAGPFADVEAGVPDGLAQMIEFEIERLTPQEQRMLEAGSLMGVAFPAWAVAAALEQETPATEEAFEALSRRLYFVRRAGEDELPDGSRSDFYVFVHGLYRHVLYQRQTPSRRGPRHIRIARRLGELFAGREATVAREMALHCEAGSDWLSAAAALRRAAQHALLRHAHAESIELLQHALRLADNLSPLQRDRLAAEIHHELAQISDLASGAARSRAS